MESIRWFVKLKPFVEFLNPTCCWSHLFFLLLSACRLFSHANLLSVLGGARKNWVSWAASHMDVKAGCSLHAPFLLWEKLWPKSIFLGTEIYHIREGMILRRWKYSSYPLQCIYSWIFCSNEMLDSQAPTKLPSSLSGCKN